MSELPEGWRDELVEVIRGAAEPTESWFTGGPALSPLAQIGVYQNQYRLRIYDALAEELPGLEGMLGDDAEALFRAYIRECPPDTWTLNRIADRMVDWLRARGAAAAHIEMAQLDTAVQAGFESAEGEPLRPEDLALMPALRLQPHVTLLRLRHNVHWIRAAGISDGEPPALETGDYPLVVFRRGIKMRHWQMALGAWGILRGIDEGLGVEGAIEFAFGKGWLDPENLSENIQRWFKDYAERNLLQLA